MSTSRALNRGVLLTSSQDLLPWLAHVLFVVAEIRQFTKECKPLRGAWKQVLTDAVDEVGPIDGYAEGCGHV